MDGSLFFGVVGMGWGRKQCRERLIIVCIHMYSGSGSNVPPWVLLICICHLYLRVVIRMLDLVLECSFSHDPAGGATISKERKPQNKKTLIV